MDHNNETMTKGFQRHRERDQRRYGVMNVLYTFRWKFYLCSRSEGTSKIVQDLAKLLQKFDIRLKYETQWWFAGLHIKVVVSTSDS